MRSLLIVCLLIFLVPVGTGAGDIGVSWNETEDDFEMTLDDAIISDDGEIVIGTEQGQRLTVISPDLRLRGDDEFTLDIKTDDQIFYLTEDDWRDQRSDPFEEIYSEVNITGQFGDRAATSDGEITIDLNRTGFESLSYATANQTRGGEMILISDTVPSVSVDRDTILPSIFTRIGGIPDWIFILFLVLSVFTGIVIGRNWSEISIDLP